MSERYNEEFKKYDEENRGKPFNPEIVAAGQKDLEDAKKGDYTINNISPNNPKDSRGMKSDLDLSATQEGIMESLISKIKDLEKAKKLVGDFMLKGPMKDTERREDFTIENLSEIRKEVDFEEMDEAITIFEKYNFDPRTSMDKIISTINREVLATKSLIAKLNH